MVKPVRDHRAGSMGLQNDAAAIRSVEGSEVEELGSLQVEETQESWSDVVTLGT